MIVTTRPCCLGSALAPVQHGGPVVTVSQRSFPGMVNAVRHWAGSRHLLPLRRWRERAGVERATASDLVVRQTVTPHRVELPVGQWNTLRQFGLQVLDLGLKLF